MDADHVLLTKKLAEEAEAVEVYTHVCVVLVAHLNAYDCVQVELARVRESTGMESPPEGKYWDRTPEQLKTELDKLQK